MRRRGAREAGLTFGVLGALLLQLGAGPAADAALERVGPNDPVHGFPLWYQDGSGLTLDFCSPLNRAELEGGWCRLLPPLLQAAPERFAPGAGPARFSEEHFYFGAEARIGTPSPAFPGFSASLSLQLKAAFRAGKVVNGDQVTLGRVRITFDKGVPASGTYRVYTPHGVFTLPNLHADAEEPYVFTQDIGPACAPGRFDCTLTSSVGAFLVPSDSAGGAELPPIPDLYQAPVKDEFAPAAPTPYPNTGRRYLADPARLGPVTGSPLPPFKSAVDGQLHDPNVFRVELVPAGAKRAVLVGETVYFTLMGRLHEKPLPGRIGVERATYTQPVEDSPTDRKLDVFVTALPPTVGRLPASPQVRPEMPRVLFYNAPCCRLTPTGVDCSNPALRGPLTRPVDAETGTPLPATTLFASAGSSWMSGQSHPARVPGAVCVEHADALGPTGERRPFFIQAAVTDQVSVTEAVFDPNAGTLSVKASSSDQLRSPPPLLTVGGYGDLVKGELLVRGVTAPPDRVTVVSSSGGITERKVVALYRTAPVVNVPIAADDVAAVYEDAHPSPINVLANDTLDGEPVPPAGLVAVVTGPQLGTVLVNPDRSFLYTPRPNASGRDSFTYTVDVNGFVSNVGRVTVNVLPVNDAPVAVSDSFKTTFDTPTVLDVLANDNDVDGRADLARVVAVTPVSGPVLVTPTVGADGSLTFSAPYGGTYQFAYQAEDAGGQQGTSLRSSPATVTVEVAAAETIAVSNAGYTAKKRRWKMSGTVAPAAGQTLTIRYATGPRAGSVVGQAVVDATGTWTLEAQPATGDLDAAAAQPPRLLVTGPGGSATLVTLDVE